MGFLNGAGKMFRMESVETTRENRSWGNDRPLLDTGIHQI
jgi:hypothetical protein